MSRKVAAIKSRKVAAAKSRKVAATKSRKVAATKSSKTNLHTKNSQAATMPQLAAAAKPHACCLFAAIHCEKPFISIRDCDFFNFQTKNCDDIFLIFAQNIDHYANMSVQYSAIFKNCKNDNF